MDDSVRPDVELRRRDAVTLAAVEPQVEVLDLVRRETRVRQRVGRVVADRPPVLVLSAGGAGDGQEAGDEREQQNRGSQSRTPEGCGDDP